MAELRASLLAEQARLTSERKSDLQVLITPENTAAEDRAPFLHDQFVAITTHSRDRHRLASIKSALQRFDRGEFGICEECDEEILWSGRKRSHGPDTAFQVRSVWNSSAQL